MKRNHIWKSLARIHQNSGRQIALKIYGQKIGVYLSDFDFDKSHSFPIPNSHIYTMGDNGSNTPILMDKYPRGIVGSVYVYHLLGFLQQDGMGVYRM